MEFNKHLIPGIQHKRITAAIMSSDSYYRSDLIEYYQKSSDQIIILDGGATFEDLCGKVQQPYSFDVVMIEADGVMNLHDNLKHLKQLGIDKIILLVNQLKDIPEMATVDVQVLYKYSPFHLITQQLVFIHFDAISHDTEPHLIETARKMQKQKQVVFYSTKGGTGKTTLAVNTACQLALKDQKVLLVDFSQFGGISVIFQIAKSKNLGDAISLLEQNVQDEKEIIETLANAIYEVEIQPERRLYVLPAASHFKMANLSLSMTDQILEMLGTLGFNTVICDTSTEISPKNISLLSWATDLFLITSSDAIVNWQLFISQDFLQQIKNPLQTQHLILNRFNPTYSIKQTEVEQILKKPVLEVIPDMELQLQNFLNRGILLTSKPSLKLHMYFRRIAHTIDPIFTDKELGRKKRFGRRGKV